MNVLVLTPDGVGSTVLQRICTLALHLDGQDGWTITMING